MSTTEAILEKLNALPPEKREDVLNYINSISKPPFQIKSGKPYSWIDTALKANLQGPPDWSEHLDDYLYGIAWPARSVLECAGPPALSPAEQGNEPTKNLRPRKTRVNRVS